MKRENEEGIFGAQSSSPMPNRQTHKKIGANDKKVELMIGYLDRLINFNYAKGFNPDIQDRIRKTLDAIEGELDLSKDG